MVAGDEYLAALIREEQVARTVGFTLCAFSVAVIPTMPYSIVRRPTDRNSGALFFPIDISLSPCAC